MAELQSNDQSTVWNRHVTDRESVWKVFRDFRDRRDQVTLRFESVETRYTARVRDVDHRRVTLEEIHPRSGEVLMNAGRAFTLAGRSDGAYVYAARIQSVGAVPGEQGNAFLIELPAQLLWQQRRRGPRFAVPASLRAGRARIILTQAGDTFAGAIEDISASGCRAKFEAVAHDLLRAKDSFDKVQLEIAGLLSISVRLAVRHRVADPKTGAVTCGLEFTRVGLDDRTRLEQFIRSLSRTAAHG